MDAGHIQVHASLLAGPDLAGRMNFLQSHLDRHGSRRRRDHRRNHRHDRHGNHLDSLLLLLLL
jgi:hypothetical protein